MQILGWLIAAIIGLAVLAGYLVILTVLVLAFLAAPTFWGTFWLLLLVLIGLAGVNKL